MGSLLWHGWPSGRSSQRCGVTLAFVVPSGGSSRPDQVQGEGPKLIDKDLLSSSRERGPHWQRLFLYIYIYIRGGVWPGAAAILVAAAQQVVYLSARLGFDPAG